MKIKWITIETTEDEDTLIAGLALGTFIGIVIGLIIGGILL